MKKVLKYVLTFIVGMCLVLGMLALDNYVSAEPYLVSDVEPIWTVTTQAQGYVISNSPTGVGYSASDLKWLFYVSDYWLDDLDYLSIKLYKNYTLLGTASAQETNCPNFFYFDFTTIQNYQTSNQYSFFIYTIQNPTHTGSQIRTELNSYELVLYYTTYNITRLNLFVLDVGGVYDSAYSIGESEGYANGYDDGFLDGGAEFDGWTLLWGALTAPFVIFSIEIIPGLYIGYFALVPIVFGLIAFLLSLKHGKGK